MAQSDFTSAYSQMFADMFRLQYQAGSRLRGTVMELHGLVGDAYKFKYMNQVAMQQHGAYGADIPARAGTVTAPSISFEDYDLKLSIDEFDQLNFNASALQGYAQTHAKALGRREDQFIINALVAGTTNQIASGGTNMSVEKLREARAILGQNEADEGDLYCVMHWLDMEALLAQTEYTSSLFNMAKPLVDPQGDEGPFAGFKIIAIGDRTLEGGLPLTAGVRSTFAFNKNAAAVGYRLDPQTRMVPIEWQARTETLSLMSAGAVVTDVKGSVEILCDES